MDFTPEQELLRDSVRRTCTRHGGLDMVRKLENDAVGYSPAFWTALAELGLLGLTLPEEFGGSGMTMLDAAIVYEELGRSLAPSPHFVSCVLAAGALRRAGSDAQKQSWLPRIATGEAVLTVAWLEPGGGFGPEGVQVTATPAGGGYVLDGVKQHVSFARAADALLVLARSPEGVVLVLVDAGAPGLTLEQQLTVASDTQFHVTFDGVTVPAEGVLGTADSWECWQETMLDGAILLAAQAVGGARAALELTVDYAQKREQFDRPLGAFQAIAHYLADATAAVDGTQTLVWEAAWARAEDRPVERLAPMAKLYAGKTFRDVTAMAQQVFGGNGFTLDFDVQLYFRRAKSWQLNYWDDRHLEELIAEQVLGPVSSR
ncbi:MAG TPA: acyl-CoA dehydrogenase family protein [Mycobacteriales bacterium]|jgi:alkylation response protein AidB-like acyl-CoA dehydrogenase|nr:acyl-CoA dehydrogenase family protein [Mycobacteriales bacterium]